MQEPVLLNKSIKANILFGKADAADEEVYMAAEKANCLDFIEGSLDESKDTEGKILDEINNDVRDVGDVLGRALTLSGKD